MKKIITCLAAGLLTLGAQSLLADDTTPPASSSTQTQTPAQKLKDMTPEERKAYMASHPELAKLAKERREVMERMGIAHGDLKGLTPEERRTKIKEAADKTVAELKEKKANGTMTEQDKTDLAFIEQHIEKAHKHVKPAADN